MPQQPTQYDEDMGYRTMTREDVAILQERRISSTLMSPQTSPMTPQQNNVPVPPVMPMGATSPVSPPQVRLLECIKYCLTIRFNLVFEYNNIILYSWKKKTHLERNTYVKNINISLNEIYNMNGSISQKVIILSAAIYNFLIKPITPLVPLDLYIQTT